MSAKVYSCSQFFNELDLLELKLETLNDVVDYFVISESTHTHSGKPKHLFFDENKKRFKKFENKIIHQIVTDTPSLYTNLETDLTGLKDDFYNTVIDRVRSGNWWNHNVESYGRDTFEKESLIRPLINCQDDDIILLSDLDEIANPFVLRDVLNTFDYNSIYHFQHDMFYYYVNLQKNEPWHGTIALSFKKFKENSFCEMRTNKRGVFVKNGGWHFTFQNGESSIREKLEAYGEQSLNLDYIKNGLSQSIENALNINQDLFGRPCLFRLRYINDGTFPEYLVKNQDKFSKYIKV